MNQNSAEEITEFINKLIAKNVHFSLSKESIIEECLWHPSHSSLTNGRLSGLFEWKHMEKTVLYSLEWLQNIRLPSGCHTYDNIQNALINCPTRDIDLRKFRPVEIEAAWQRQVELAKYAIKRRIYVIFYWQKLQLQRLEEQNERRLYKTHLKKSKTN